MAVRAKMRCESIRGTDADQSVKTSTQMIKFTCVYEPDASRSDENARFTKATPWGTVELAIDNPLAISQFMVGRTYYVDFTPAE